MKTVTEPVVVSFHTDKGPTFPDGVCALDMEKVEVKDDAPYWRCRLFAPADANNIDLQLMGISELVDVSKGAVIDIHVRSSGTKEGA